MISALAALPLLTLAITPDPAQTTAAPAAVELLGVASLPGDDRDRSRLYSALGGKIPHNRLGSFGSGIDYTGADDTYLACDDRGPGDGAFDFRPRVQKLRITINPAAAPPTPRIHVELLATTLLTDERGGPLTGKTDGFNPAASPAEWPRFDPEAIRLNPATPGQFFISDEYGPAIDLFDNSGRRLRRAAIPESFTIKTPDADGERELPPANTRGRQANRGFEGLAITPDGATLYAILQSPLIQDGALDPDNNRIGRNIRILELSTTDQPARQFVYPLESSKDGVSEILWAAPDRLLVLERDGKPGVEARRRGIYLISLKDATDVSTIDALPSRDLPASIRPARKSRLIDFLDPTFALIEPAAGGMPEKIEGLTFGPDLPDHRRTLIVTTDNDLKADQPTWFWVFAVDAGALGGGGR